MLRLFSIGTACCALGACATSTSNIEAKTVNVAVYNAYDCAQLKNEIIRVQGRLQSVGGMQDKQAASDRLLVGAGVMFSPMLATGMLLVSKDLKKEVATLKGEDNALREAFNIKRCSD